jgi:hypothetical protein
MNWYKNVLYHTGVKKRYFGSNKGYNKENCGHQLSVKKLKNCENGQF